MQVKTLIDIYTRRRKTITDRPSNRVERISSKLID